MSILSSLVYFLKSCIFFSSSVYTQGSKQEDPPTQHTYTHKLLHMQVIVLVLLFVSTCILFLPA